MKSLNSKQTQYDNLKWATIVKSNAHYTCIECGSTEYIQAHDPTRRHIDPKDGQCLCAECHSKKHPDVPRNLFLVKGNHQPYWENKSASSLANEIRVHPRTIYRIAVKLSIKRGYLSLDDELLIKHSVGRNRHDMGVKANKGINKMLKKRTYFMNVNDIAAIEKLAMQNDMTNSDIVRMAVKEFIKRKNR